MVVQDLVLLRSSGDEQSFTQKKKKEERETKEEEDEEEEETRVTPFVIWTPCLLLIDAKCCNIQTRKARPSVVMLPSLSRLTSSGVLRQNASHLITALGRNDESHNVCSLISRGR